MSSLSSLTRSQVRMLMRLDNDVNEESSGLSLAKVHTADMGVLMTLIRLELVALVPTGLNKAQYRLTPEGRQVRGRGSV